MRLMAHAIALQPCGNESSKEPKKELTVMLESYRHLINTDQCWIYALKKSDRSNSEITRQLGHSRSTVHRELQRNF